MVIFEIYVHAVHYDAVVNHTRFVFNEFVKITTTQKAPFSVLFLVLIDDRRLPSFKTSCGLL